MKNRDFRKVGLVINFSFRRSIIISVETINPTRAFEIVNGYLGWGDLGERSRPGIWFIGIEEAVEWGKTNQKNISEAGEDPIDVAKRQINELKLELIDGWYKYSIWEATKSQLLRVIDQISGDLGVNSQSLWRPECRVFQANLYPLGKPRTNMWPSYCPQLFGFGKEQYEEKVKQRLIDIHKRWLECRPQATVCFGTNSQYKDMFQYCFLEGQGFPLTEHPAYKIFFNDARRVIICQHPASRWWRKGRSDQDKLEFIKGKLKHEWKVELP